MQKSRPSALNEISGLQRGFVTEIYGVLGAKPDDGHVRLSAEVVDAESGKSNLEKSGHSLLSRGRLGAGEGIAETSVASSAARPPIRAGQPLRRSTALPRLPFDADDEQIRRVAFACSSSCHEAARESADLHEAVARTRAVCHAIGIEPPSIKKPSGADEVHAAILRAACPIWWRRRLRILVARRTEAKAITTGEVHRAAAPYCSRRGLSRHRAAKRRNSELLAAMQAVNELGETFSLEELAATSTSCPRLRRNELMARVKGLETLADQRGDAGLFVTWTLPSRFHAISSKSGRPNPAFDGTMPGQAARYLGSLWARARAALLKAGCRPYGLRVAEPHADGTPHWHFLLFIELAQVESIKNLLLHYALSESPDEPGAQRHRILFTDIDKTKGSATGYIAKYVSKNIDGHALDSTKSRDAGGDLEQTGDDAAHAAESIRAWASIWGIRQFQFFGTPPMSFWRELRRVEASPGIAPAIESARAPADDGDYATHVQAVGGVCASRAALTLATYRYPVSDEPNRYGERVKGRVRGVVATDGSGVLLTRLHTWTILAPERGACEVTWTCVNNCTAQQGSRATIRGNDQCNDKLLVNPSIICKLNRGCEIGSAYTTHE